MQSLGYGYGRDECYEITSPVATHPRSLQIALNGLYHHRLCPQEAFGTVTQHVSIGTDAFSNPTQAPIQPLIQALRATELVGGTSPSRLLTPFEIDFDSEDILHDTSWNSKGLYGIHVTSSQTMRDWLGSGSRVEFRTLQYRNREIFSETTDALYYLSRGIFSKAAAVHDLWDEFDTWFMNYCSDNDLTIVAVDEPYYELYRQWDTQRQEINGRYIRPYALRLADGPDLIVRSQLARTILMLREELGMSEIETVFSKYLPDKVAVIL